MQYTRKRAFGQKLTNAFSSVTSNRSIAIRSFFVILAALPVIVFLIRNQTQQYGYAATITNLLQDGLFENTGTDWLVPWSFGVKTGAAATISQDSITQTYGVYSAKVDVTQSSTTAWYVQLSQTTSLTAGQLYTLTFSAKASVARAINIVFQQNYSPYMEYANQTFTITTSWQTYTMIFTPSTTDASVIAVFNLAQATESVWLDNVVLSTGASATSAPTPSWALMFDDEFNGTSVDTTKWSVGDTLTNSQWWCDSPNWLSTANANMITEINGLLHITTEQMLYAGKPYQTGCIDTYKKYWFLYGKVDIRAKMPPITQSWWPGFWLLPENAGDDFEIDSLELINEPCTLYFNNHDWRDNMNNGTSIKPGPDYSANFHEYEVEWSPSAIIWRVDGVEYFRVTNARAISNEPMYLILDTEIGAPGSWPGAPLPTSAFPGTMGIDYVRIYQASNATPTPTAVSIASPTRTPTPFVTPV